MVQQLTIFDDFPDEQVIKKIGCSLFSYEVGIDGVAKIKLTEHGSEKLHIYKVTNAAEEVIMFAGLLVPYEIEEGIG